MSQRSGPAEPTRQKDVGPGDETGVYYITLCNLPFGTSWQDLKDFTRTVCDVDHVEVFRTSTSGWVRVIGRHNFDMAWGLLNGGQFNGRCIIASDRNKRESIKIKELVDTSPELSAPHPSPVESCGAAGPPAHPTHTSFPVSYEGHAVAVSPYNIPVSMASAGGNPSAYSTADCYEGPYSSSQSAGSYGHYGYWAASLPYHGGAAWPSNNGFDATTSDAADGGEYIRTERRKILIQDLPFRARPDQVSTWVRKTMGAHASKMKAIEVPQGSSGSEIRGYAYATFRSSSSAKEAVGLLDQETFKGRQVSVRVASDGVTLIDRPQEATGIDMDRDDNAKKTRRSKHREAPPPLIQLGQEVTSGQGLGEQQD